MSLVVAATKLPDRIKLREKLLIGFTMWEDEVYHGGEGLVKQSRSTHGSQEVEQRDTGRGKTRSKPLRRTTTVIC